uniref:Uncharacterized protein n=1 Tax=Arundo donax TaxID=35708 RepID=A0A0A9G6C3_ARUDO
MAIFSFTEILPSNILKLTAEKWSVVIQMPEIVLKFICQSCY